jgi:uncharacterized caspase-like protein
MIGIIRKSTIWAFTIWLACQVPGISHAKNHALLIGIGNYKQRTLEGPAYDVAALTRVLIEQYDFKRANVRTLVNREAGKFRILSEMQRLVQISRPGDRVFIYYSGHGTSRRDELLSLPLPHASGALVPADFKWDSNQSIETQMSQLIVGKRDLRPILTRLDQDRQVLVIFDTCFSGNTVRGIGEPKLSAVNRYMPLGSKSVFSEEQQIGSFAENLKPDEPYPYQNTFYISASTENETAKDIRSDLLYLYPTIDGNPHGVLTDSLLRVLGGQTPVDTNNDGRWSQIELYKAVCSGVQQRFRQTPQALPREGENAVQLYSRTFFERSAGNIIPAAQKEAGGPSGLPAADYRQGYSSSHAIVVGIDKYRLWPHLEYAAKDAREVAALLETKGFQTYVLTDENATRTNILRNLDTIEKSADVNSRVVIYFAGHGLTEDLPGGGEKGYIVPVDADTYNWKGTMLAMNRLNQRIRQIKAKHILLAFDACYSGLGLTRSIKRHPEQDSAYIQKMMQTRSIQILTAGSHSEQAIETDGHGLFTEHLLAALSGTADINTDGYITATEIYATLRPSVTQQSYSRQTPQFGYIEGNGDIIFYNKLRKAETSVVLINSRIDGIDVWAGTTKIGRRLPAGRHRLTANAGHVIIIVKKGSQTLYRKRIVLRVNREFPIQLPSPTYISQDHRPFSMLTIANPNIKNYSNSIAYDLDGDGREEIITASGNRLCALKPDGSIFWERKFNFPINLNLIDHWNNQTAIGLSAIKNKKAHLLLLNSGGEIIWRNDGKITARRQAISAVRERIAQLADIDQDGYEDVIAISDAGSGLKSRVLILYDRDERELWRYAVGPELQNIVIWPKERGRPDIIIGTFSPGDGNNELHNKTSDRQAYVISIDGYGRTNWVIRMGGYYTGVRVLLADLKGDGTQALYAHKYTAYNYRDDEGGIYKISRSGSILNRFESGDSILSVIAGISDRSSERRLYAVDNKSNLIKLDNKLTQLQKKSLKAKSGSREIRLVGVHDYDGDGVDDILMYSFDRLFFPKNPFSLSGSKNRKFYSNLKFQILSQDFSKLIKSVSIGEEWDKRGGFAVKDLDRPNGPHYAFMALSEKVMLYNY